MGEVAGDGGDELHEGVVAAGAVATGAAGEVMEEVREGGMEVVAARYWRGRGKLVAPWRAMGGGRRLPHERQGDAEAVADEELELGSGE